MKTLQGLVTARGYAYGPAFLYRGTSGLTVPEGAVEPSRATDEVSRLTRARAEARRDLENLVAVMHERAGREGSKIFEGHIMLLEDPQLVKETVNYILIGHLNAEAAVRKTGNGARALFERMNDPYFRERVRDFDDVERRLLRALTGCGAAGAFAIKVPSIFIADDLTPSEAIGLPRDLVLGIATNGGSPTSHVALLARAMGIPAVCGLGDATAQVRAGETVMLDGAAGTLTVSPDTRTLLDFRDLVERQKELSEEIAVGAPAGTLREGGEVLVQANAHPGMPLDDIRRLGARGIGLYRSEYLWLNGGVEPSEDEQFEAYREIVSFAASLSPDAATTIRVLDIGGDKIVRSLAQSSGAPVGEANPFLGNRSIRYLLSNRSVFKTQLRAILRASAFGKTRIMYPMVSCVEELRAAAACLDAAKQSLRGEGIAFDDAISVGTMIEVPSAALIADELAQYVQFFSVGTNDLVQYTMAADRGNEAVASLYQPTHPAVLKLIRMTVDAARRRGISVSVCGESAADPMLAVLWAAMGVDALSLSATYIPQTAKLFSRLTRADLADYLKTVEARVSGHTAAEIYSDCRAWMLAKIPDLDNIVI